MWFEMHSLAPRACTAFWWQLLNSVTKLKICNEAQELDELKEITSAGGANSNNIGFVAKMVGEVFFIRQETFVWRRFEGGLKAVWNRVKI